jgi:hypothetical protein
MGRDQFGFNPRSLQDRSRVDPGSISCQSKFPIGSRHIVFLCVLPNTVQEVILTLSQTPIVSNAIAPVLAQRIFLPTGFA